MRRLAVPVLAVIILGAGCTSPSVPIDDVAPLPEITGDDMGSLLASSGLPVVLNVWASWCSPCRSEAPLLRDAGHHYADRVRFVGVAVRDRQDPARRFIAEFGLDGFDHFLDAVGAIPARLGGVGVPITFFFSAGGELAHVHQGVIDERTLALRIDQLLRGG